MNSEEIDTTEMTQPEGTDVSAVGIEARKRMFVILGAVLAVSSLVIAGVLYLVSTGAFSRESGIEDVSVEAAQEPPRELSVEEKYEILSSMNRGLVDTRTKEEKMNILKSMHKSTEAETSAVSDE